jgi:hypothetical protein
LKLNKSTEGGRGEGEVLLPKCYIDRFLSIVHDA